MSDYRYHVVVRAENVEDKVLFTYSSRTEAEECFMSLEMENEDPYTMYQVLVEEVHE